MHWSRFGIENYNLTDLFGQKVKNSCRKIIVDIYYLSSFNKIHDGKMKTCNKDFSKNCKKSISFGLNYARLWGKQNPYGDIQ